MSKEVTEPEWIKRQVIIGHLQASCNNESKLNRIMKLADAILASSEPFDAYLHPYRIAQQIKEILNE